MAAALVTVVAALVAFLTAFPLRRYAGVLGLLDLPNARSSHRVPTPRGGGAAIVVGAAAALLVTAQAGQQLSAGTLFAAAALVALVGLLDDRFGLPPLVKLAAQICAAILVVRTYGPLPAVPLPPPLYLPLAAAVGSAAAVLWIVAVVNFFNFMDGIDGLAAGQAAASGIGIAVAAWSADASVLALAVAGACAGFLCHNAPPARVFMGDSGSGFLGFTLAAIPFLAPPSRRSDALLAVAIGLALFLLDPLLTLVRRAVERKNVLQSHREHLYQQLVPPDAPAGRVTAAYTAAALGLALLAGLGFRFPPLLWAGCVAGVGAFVVVWYRARHSAPAGGGGSVTG